MKKIETLFDKIRRDPSRYIFMVDCEIVEFSMPNSHTVKLKKAGGTTLDNPWLFELSDILRLTETSFVFCYKLNEIEIEIFKRISPTEEKGEWV